MTPCAHTKTKTETLDRDLRPEEIAKAESVTNVEGLGREGEPGPNVSVPIFEASTNRIAFVSEIATEDLTASLAAEWLASGNADSATAVLPQLRDRFGLSAREAIEACRQAALIRARAYR
ncbi:hypothetical protein EB235_08255 [Mesorhizobium loti R88b]|uniref:Uncharacterized protein n=1 Tax=Mesorhizobium loti R88b TaxID=935548 RepID=A0A6M7WIB1_RHILI|nr:hypothetical protein EB235_08255 [Mesorhizobium loti R88b]